MAGGTTGRRRGRLLLSPAGRWGDGARLPRASLRTRRLPSPWQRPGAATPRPPSPLFEYARAPAAAAPPMETRSLALAPPPAAVGSLGAQSAERSLRLSDQSEQALPSFASPPSPAVSSGRRTERLTNDKAGLASAGPIEASAEVAASQSGGGGGAARSSSGAVRARRQVSEGRRGRFPPPSRFPLSGSPPPARRPPRVPRVRLGLRGRPPGRGAGSSVQPRPGLSGAGRPG